ncbi:hypothetical protein NDU88_000599 [Pleurodeles waltl]|uniref:Ig-like domain-containing protein n=1 Tax=Pleurodeles waltl TaxID=8319 RepID=A0AAV7NA03_PLEWA|nr:hypothetical protein NDU88_000599 [Pleurodeles waltl]
MASPGAALLLLLPLLFYPGCTEDVKVVNALVGGTVQLNLTYSGKATGYTWTKGSQRVAEWDDPLDVTYYVTLKGRCQLNKSTGVLIITNLQETDSARYKGEALVNSQYIPSNFDLHVFPNLINPTVTCYVKGENYTIDCDHQPEPKTYSWRSQGQLVAERNTDYSLSNSGKTLILKNAKVPFQSLECVVQNPVSKKSAPVPQDCFEGLINNKAENTHGHHGLIASVVIFPILAVFFGFFISWKSSISPLQWLSRRGNDARGSPEQQNLKHDTAQDPLGSTPEREEGTKVTETEGPLLTNEDGLQYSPAVPERVMKKEGGPDTSVLAQGAWEPCLQRRVEGQSSGGGVVDDVPQEIPDGVLKTKRMKVDN